MLVTGFWVLQPVDCFWRPAPAWSVGVQQLAMYPRDHCWVQSCSTSPWMMGQSVPAMNLLTIQNWKEWVLHQSFTLPLSWALTGWRNRLTGASWILIRRSAKSCLWEGRALWASICCNYICTYIYIHICTYIFATGCISALQKRPRGSGGHQVGHRPAVCSGGKES